MWWLKIHYNINIRLYHQLKICTYVLLSYSLFCLGTVLCIFFHSEVWFGSSFDPVLYMEQFYCDYILCGLGLSLLGLTVICQQSQYRPVLVWRTGQDLEIINPFMKVRREQRDREFSSTLFCWHCVVFCNVWARLYGRRSGKSLLWPLHVLILLHMAYAPHSGVFSALLKGPSAEGTLPPSHSTSFAKDSKYFGWSFQL